jgi:hypothetical protein
MPHTSRRQKRDSQPSITRNKRGEVASNDGWTRITRSDKGLGIDAPNQAKMDLHGGRSAKQHDQEDLMKQLNAGVFHPTEVPDGVTVEKALSHYNRCASAWESSKTWAAIHEILTSRPLPNIDNCVCLGLGSPTGLILPGPIDRRTVSMYQLAAFVSVISILTPAEPHDHQQHSRTETTARPVAQDPRFNAIDTALLAHLGIDVVSHPRAFNLITPDSLAFCPGPEQFVLKSTLARCPAIYLGSGALDIAPLSSSPYLGNGTCTCHRPELTEIDQLCHCSVETMLHHFKREKESVRLPDFDDHDYAFYDMHLFWSRTAD